MRSMKWVGIGTAVVLSIACCMVWVTIPSRGITVSGISAEGTSFGKPGLLHFILSFVFILFSIIPRIWAKRSNLLVTALNMAWVIRNYFVITACRGGDCPEKHTAVYLLLIASVVMLISSLFPDVKIEKEGE